MLKEAGVDLPAESLRAQLPAEKEDLRFFDEADGLDEFAPHGHRRPAAAGRGGDPGDFMAPIPLEIPASVIAAG
ncbi:MAG: hypothetical protein MUE57_08415 [Syntrophales bacterium]|nr:hypothetical protein [Syntrophales bacterium]